MRQRWLKWTAIALASLAALLLVAYLTFDLLFDYALERAGGDVLTSIFQMLEQPANEPAMLDHSAATQGAAESDGKVASVTDAEAESAAELDPSHSSPEAPTIGVGEAGNIAEQLTTSEKMVISSIALSVFTSDDLAWFERLAGGGVSLEEKKQMRERFLQRMSEEQYNTLIEIAKKYGLSQGRSYDEVKQQ